MKLTGLYQIITIIFLYLTLLPSALAHAVEVDGNTTTVNMSISGNVCGNTGNPLDNCTGPNVPGTGDSRDVTNNRVIIESGVAVTHSTSGGVYGGYTEGEGNVTDNTVIINGSTVVAYGGYRNSTSGVASVVFENEVTVKNGGSADYIYGGINYNGDVIGNIVIVERGGTVTNNINGGLTNTTNSNVTGNIVEIRGNVGGNVYAGSHYMNNGKVLDNVVIVSGTVGKTVFGAESNGSGLVSGNEVLIESGAIIIGGVTGAISYSRSSDLIDNIVTVRNGARVGGNVVGAIINNGSGDAVNNTVNISGNVGGSVWGAYGGTHSGNIINNTVNLTDPR